MGRGCAVPGVSQDRPHPPLRERGGGARTYPRQGVQWEHLSRAQQVRGLVVEQSCRGYRRDGLTWLMSD